MSAFVREVSFRFMVDRTDFIQGQSNNFFFWKIFEYFLKFLFLFENTILPVNNGK